MTPMDNTPEDADFDLAAAGFRSDQADIAQLVEALAVKLERVLPDLCTVKRRRHGILSRRERVDSLAVQLGSTRFVLHRRKGDLVAEVESAVHDMRRTTDKVALHDWLDQLRNELEKQAESSARAREALHALLNP
jgi:exonuclease VII large subunit